MLTYWSSASREARTVGYRYQKQFSIKSLIRVL